MSSVEFTSHLDEIQDAFNAAVKKALTEIGIEAEAHAKEIITEKGAVDTGLLRNSITWAIGGKGANKSSYSADTGGKSGSYSGTAPKKDVPCVYIGSNVSYCPYIETGARGKSPRPFLKPAVEDFRDEYKEIVEDNLKNG